MGSIKIKGIVIAENNMGDFDKMITLLTPNGKINCSAKGARRSKSQLMAATQFLCFGEFLLFKGSNTYTLNSCEIVELFYPLREDYDKFENAVKLTKIIQDVTDENQNTYRILQLFLNTLYIMSNSDIEFRFLNSIFKLRLACLLGFTPRVDKCVNCGEEKIHSFSFIDNGFKCENCAKQDTGAMTVSESTATAIKYIVKAPAKKIFSFQISDDNKRQLEIITKIFFNEKLEKEYK